MHSGTLNRHAAWMKKPDDQSLDFKPKWLKIFTRRISTWHTGLSENVGYIPNEIAIY